MGASSISLKKLKFSSKKSYQQLIGSPAYWFVVTIAQKRIKMATV